MNFRKNILTKKILSVLFAGCAIFQLLIPTITFENLSGIKSANVFAAADNYSVSLSYVENTSKKIDKNNFNKTFEYKHFHTQEFIDTAGDICNNTLFRKYIKYISPDPGSCDHFTKIFFLRSPPTSLS